MSFPRAWLSMTMSTADGRWTFHRRRTTATTGSGNHICYFLTVGGMQTTPAATRTNPTTTTATQQQGKKLSPADLHAGRTESLCPNLPLCQHNGSQSDRTGLLYTRRSLTVWTQAKRTITSHVSSRVWQIRFVRTKMWDTPGSHFRESPANRRLSITRKNTCDTITRVIYWTPLFNLNGLYLTRSRRSSDRYRYRRWSRFYWLS